MTVDNGLLTQLEALGKLSLDTEERKRFAKDLNEILDYVGILSELSSDGEDGVCPVSADSLRADEAVPSENPEALLENAETADGCFSVPRTVE